MLSPRRKSKSQEVNNILRHFISRVVKPPEQGEITRFWPREVKLAKELYKQYPDNAFWSKIEFGFKPNSLAFFKMTKGIQALALKYKEFHYTPPERTAPTLQLEDGKVGETRYNPQPRFMKDFL